MKIHSLKFISAFIFIIAASVAISQPIDLNPLKEKVWLSSDRTLYVVGEKILFSAFVTVDNQMEAEWSKILYVEIISPDGKSVAGNKFPLVDFAAQGCIVIPETTITGVYYLRAYTKYMRNQGPDEYAYLAIKIVNPLINDVVDGNDEPLQINVDDKSTNRSGEYKLTTDKLVYAPHQSVNVALAPPLGGRGQKISIAVVPESSAYDFAVPIRKESHSFISNNYYPETRGVSVTGELRDKASDTAVTGTRVNLTIIGHGRDFMATQTDTAGRYFFSLPDYTGSRDLFLCAVNDSTSQTQLLVDNDFCSLPVHLPSPEFKLTSEERETVLNLARNARINLHYNADTIPCTDEYATNDNIFYGKPSEIIVIDDYVQLLSLEEYFHELPASVNVKKRHGHSYFKVLGTQPEMTYYDPLVLVDLVAVNNPEKILKSSPASVARIEVINVPYVKGDMTYGGIVSIISKKGDFAGIDLPSSGIFINYQGLSDTCNCQVNSPDSDQLPDARNTLYWNPGVELNADQRFHFSIMTPDTPGKYKIVMKGLNKEGFATMKEISFAVKE